MRPRIGSAALAALSLLLPALPASAETPKAPPAAASAAPGDAARGRVLVADRRKGLCLLCHRAPIASEPFQGDLGPDLAGAGRRFTAAELRARLVDSRAFNAASIMPAYFKTEGLMRVGASWQGRTIFTAQEIDDVVAYLVTLQ